MTVKSSGIVSRNQLASQAPTARRVLAIVLWAISWFGTFVCFNGGWSRIAQLDAQWIGALVFSLVAQGVVSYFQWTFMSAKNYALYAGMLALSVTPSVVSYWVLVTPIAVGLYSAFHAAILLVDSTAVKASTPPVLATIFAALVVIAVSLAIDIMPERQLVKENSHGKSDNA